MTQTVLLGDIGKVITGKTPPKANPEYWGGELDFITPTDFTDSKYISPKRQLSSEGEQALHRIVCPANSVIVTCIGSDMGKVALARSDYISNQQINSLVIDEERANPNFIYYLLKLNRPLLRKYAESGGSTMPIINKSTFERLAFAIPDLETQKKIADILGTIDEKIELNRQMNETLEQMGQALFRHYFIDNPEAERWENGMLGDVIVNFDSKRKPLSSRQRAEMQGEYRYFGATSVMDYVNNYLFDGKYLLLAEDGSVIKKDGTPYLQYIWGKFWVNNHAHILQAKAPFTVEYLYLLLSMSNVQSLVSGAVQLKINQKAMNNFKIKIPPTALTHEFCAKVDPLFEQRRKNEEELQTLTTLRDTLLPRLISGKVKVS